MHQISNNNFDDLYINLARKMERDGQIISQRKNKTKEIAILKSLGLSKKSIVKSFF